MGSFPSTGATATAKAINAAGVMDAILADLGSAAAGAGGANLLVNGGLRVAQRGGGPFTANGAYTADRWQLSLQGGSTASVTAALSASPPARADRYAQVAYTHAAGGSATLEQLLELWPLCKGQPLAMSAWVWANAANMARLLLQDGVAPIGGAYHAGDSTWRRLDVAFTAAAGATQLKAALQCANASGTARMSGAMLVFGPQAMEYVPEAPAIEQARCERYYEVHGGSAGMPYVRGYAAAAAGEIAIEAIPWRARKGGAPTVSKVGTWGINNAGQPTIANANGDGYLLQIASLAAGYYDAGPNSSDDFVIGEWNPA